MSVLVVFTESMPTAVAAMLDAAGLSWKAVSSVRAFERLEAPDGWSGAVVCAGSDPETAGRMCEALRALDVPVAPIILLCDPEHAEQLARHSRNFDDLMLQASADELRARLAVHANRRAHEPPHEVLEYEGLTINLVTYQAAVLGRPLDMTYMEYKLLKHFVQHANRVLTREHLLRDVWGYAYYGGARTVDVHVRRLRAKLGDEYAALIQTVRSVGYVFGRERWDD